MTIAASTERHEGHCLRCGRHTANVYGSGCSAKIRAAFRVTDLSAWTPRQMADAAELVWDGGVVPTSRPGVFRTVSHDGERVYLTSVNGCTCQAGQGDKACLHRCAVVVILATYAEVEPVALAAEVPAAVAAVPVPAPAPRDLLAELEAMVEFELAHA